MPIEVRPSSGSIRVGIQKNGTVSLSQGVCTRLGYETGDSILLYYIERGPLVILLKKVVDDEDTLTLSYLNKNASGTSGGQMRSKPFYDKVLKPRVRLPKSRLRPIFPDNWHYDLGVFIEEVQWERVDFSRNGYELVEKDRLGVYRLLDSGNNLLRYGEGNLANRMAEHLKESTFVEQVRSFEWTYVYLKQDAQIIERLLLEQYVEQYGSLPPLNSRLA